MIRTIVTRSQHAKRGKGPFPGPGMYVAGVEHDGTFEPSTPLRQSVAAKRGWKIVFFGEYYWNRLGPNSMYHRAMLAAEAWKKECPA